MLRSFLVLLVFITTLVQVDAQVSCDVSVTTTDVRCNGESSGAAKVTVNGQAGGSPAGCMSAATADAQYTTGCTGTYSSNTGEVLVAPGQQICLTAGNFTGGIQVTGGTLVISGNATPSYLNINGNNPTFTLIILSSATAQFSSLNLFGSSTVKNYGTLKMLNSAGFNGVLENNGTIAVTGDLSINAPYGTFTNRGTVTISGNFNNYNTTTNGGTLTVNGILNNNSGSTLNNQCTLTVAGDLNNNTKIINAGKITVGATSHMNGSSLYQGYAGAVYSTVNTTVDGLVQGMSSSCSSIKVSGNTVINGSAVFSGAIDYCDANGIETNTGTFTAPASRNCSCSSVSATYAWQSPLSGTTAQQNNLAAGTYSVLVSAQGCTAVTKTFTINAPAVLTAVVSPAGLSAAVAASGGTAPYSYVWSGNQSTLSSASYAASGTYTVQVTDSKGCSTTQNFTVTAPPAGSCAITVVTKNPTCAGAGDGSATVYLNGNVLGTGTSGSGTQTPAGCSAVQTSTYTCTTGCTQTITDNNAGINVAAGQQVCLTATAYTGNINVTGGTLVICGKATPQNINYNTNGAAFTMIVNGELTLSNLNLPANCTLKNYGKVTYTSSVSFNGRVENYGTMTAGGDFNNNASTGTFFNYGTLTVSGNLNNNVQGVNSGILTITGNLQINGGSTFTNNCTIQAGNEFINNASVTNNGKITVAQWTRLNGSSTTTLAAGASLNTQHLTLDGTVTGSGTTCSALKVTGQSIVNGSGKLQGQVSLCMGSGPNTFTGTVTSPATKTCSCVLDPIQYSSPLLGMNNPYQGLPAGTYSVTVQTEGCAATVKTFTITDPAAITASVSVSGKTASVNAGGGQGALVYTWDGVAGSSASHTYVNDGTYQVAVSDSKNCSKTLSFHIPVQTAADSSCNKLFVEYIAVNQVRITCTCPTSACTIIPSAGVPTNPVTTIPRPVKDSTVLVKTGPNTVVAVVVTGTYINPGTETGTGSSGTDLNTLTIVSTVTAESSPGKNDGSIQLTITGGSGDYTISNNFNTQTNSTTINNVGSGEVLVTVYDNKTGFTKVVSVTVGVKPSNSYQLVSTGTTPTGEVATVQAQVTGTNPTTNTVVQWSTGPTGFGPVPVPTWVYTTGYVTATISESWANPKVYVLPVVTACTTSVTPALTSTPVTCKGSSNGSVSITNLPAGGSVAWSGTSALQTTNTASNLSAGTYRADVFLTLANGNKCKAGSASITLTEPDRIQVQVKQSTSNTGSFTAQVTGGVAPYTYQWSNSIQTATATIAAGGLYQVQVQDSKGCIKITQLNIPIQPCGPGIGLDITQLSCTSATSGKIAASTAISGAAYYWSGTGISNHYTATQENLSAGTYVVSVAGWNPQCLSRVGVSLKQPLPLKAVSKQAGSTVNIVVSNGTPNYKVVWRLDNKQTDTRSDLTPGTSYTVDITDSKGCTLVYTFTFDPCAANPVHVTIKMNGSAATPQVKGGTAPYKYAWMLETAGGTAIPAGQDSVAVQNTLNGIYKLTVIDALNCKATIQVTGPNCGMNSIGVIPAATSCNTACDGNAKLSGTIPNGAVITWDNTAVANRFVQACAGLHTVQIQNAQGCYIQQDFTVPAGTSACTDPNPAVVHTVPGSCTLNAVLQTATSKLNKQCFGDASYIDIKITGGFAPYNMSWDVQLAGASTLQNFKTDKEDYANPQPGSYTFHITDQRGCTKTVNATVQGPAQPLVTTVRAVAASCPENPGSIAFTFTGGTAPYSIAETSNPLNATGSGIVGSSGQNSYSINPSTAGQYIYLITDASGCSQRGSASLTDVSTAAAGFSGGIVASQMSLGFGDQSSLSPRTVSGYTYSWNGFDHPAQRVQTVTAAGTYSVTYNRTGCNSYTRSITLTAVSSTDPVVKSVLCSATSPLELPVDTVDHCADNKRIAADAFAQYRYELYAAEQKHNIRNQYLKAVMASANESLTMSFSDQEEHYTLYYYDQSGNLVRTVPPAGVKVLSADQTTQAVNEITGVTASTGKILTEHTYTTTYAYNSLNQLVHQDIPDHNRMDLWQTAASSAALNGGTVSAVGYGSAGNGLMLSNTANKAQLLTTADAGKTWQAAQNLGLGKITGISRVSNTVFFAAGDKGTFLASTDAGHSWSLLPLPTSVAVKQVSFSDVNNGWIITENGLRYITADGGHSWPASSVNSSLQTILGTGVNVTDVSVSGSSIWVIGSNNSIYQSADGGQTWSAKTIAAPADGSGVILNAGYAMVGPQGTIYQSTGDVNSNTLKVVRTGLNQNISQLITDDNGHRYALSSGGQIYYNGGILTDAWTAAGPAGITSISKEGALVAGYTGSSAYVFVNGTASSAISVSRLRAYSGGVFVGLSGNVLAVYTGLPGTVTGTAYTVSPAMPNLKDFYIQGSRILALSTTGDVYESAGIIGNAIVFDFTNGANPPATITPTIKYSNVSSFISDGTNVYLKTAGANPKIIAYSGLAQVVQLSAATSDVALTSSSTGFIVESGQLKRFTAAGGTINAGAAIAVQAAGLKSITTTGTKTYAAGDNGEVYVSTGTGFSYVPTVGITQSFIDAQYSGTTVQLLSRTNAYTYTEGMPALTPAGTYSNAQQVANSPEGVQVASSTAATGDAYSVDAGAYPFILGADLGKMWYKAGSSTAYTAAAINILPLSGLAYATGSNVIAVGKQGTILTSTDAGSSWKMVYSGTPADLTGVSASGNTALAIAATGTVLYSGDGGQTWTKVTTAPAAPTGVKVTPSVVLITSGNTLYKSTNGGQTYSAETLPSTPAGTLRSVWLDADGYGFIAGDNGTAYRIKPATTTTTNSFIYTLIGTDANTTDDKGTGIPVQNLSTVQFNDRLTGYITGPNSLVLKTVDGGYHWKNEAAGAAGSGTPIVAVSGDAQNGTLIGSDGSVNALNDQAEQFNSRYWYDELGRLVLSQNAKQFTIGNYETAANITAGTSTTSAAADGTVRAYSYTLYDPIGRITEVGELLTDQAVATYKNASQVKYDAHTAFIAGGFKHQVSKTYYDRNLTPPAGFTQAHLRNRVAYTTYQQEPTVSELQQTYYSYDVHGNVNSLLQIIQKDGQTLSKQVDYEYDLISGNVNKVYYQKKQPDQLIHKYSYDGDNRITEVETSTNNVLFTQEATYQYYAHGPLARTTIGELNVETQNYAYTVQGWIKQVQGEAFGYALGYNDKDYAAIGTGATVLATPVAGSGTTSKGLYNGNIASMTSNTPAIASTNFQQQYSYDQLNRITASVTPGGGNVYSTSYSYDANGNIKTLGRYDGSGAQFDQLSYSYETKANGYLHTTNKLRAVYDAIGTTATTADIENQSADNYSYDAIGNLVADNQEEIAKIEWTVSGKVKRVIRTPTSMKPSLEFEYDASGQRIVKKVIRTDGTVSSTYYLRDEIGEVMSVYQYDSVSDDIPHLSEQYLLGAERLGVYTPTGLTLPVNMGNRSFGRKSYELSDHLGNVRATLSDYRRLATQAIVNSATDYYPFGMVARSYVSSQTYRYGFNGKEDDSETGWQDYGMRMYNPILARFFSVDPITYKYPELTPYQFASNTPIKGIDMDGLEVVFPEWYNNTYGVLLGLRESAEEKIENVKQTATNYVENPTEIINDGWQATKGAGIFIFQGTFAPVYDIAGVETQTQKAFDSYVDKTVQDVKNLPNATPQQIGKFVGDKAYEFGVAYVLSKAGAPILSRIKGKWVAESTAGWSSKAKSYQEFVTGAKPGNAFDVNGVKFDGFKGNTLLEAKSSYDNFVSKTGDFYSWFKGKDSLLDQARRQIKAANGASIEWNFSSQKSLNATQKLFKENNITGIDLKYNPQ